jgi:hypothetical protein
MEMAMNRLDFDPTPILLAFQKFIGEQRAILGGRNYNSNSNSNNYSCPPLSPEHSPVLPQQW